MMIEVGDGGGACEHCRRADCCRRNTRDVVSVRVRVSYGVSAWWGREGASIAMAVDYIGM